MERKASATVRSMAAELGISPITVSRALRGNPSVRLELAEKVRSLAEKAGYQSDPMVSEVMGGLGRRKGVHYRETIAFVWTHERSESTAEEKGVHEAAEALGYRVESVKPWTQRLSERDVSRILWARGIRGVLLAPNYSRPDPRYELEWERFATVLMGSSLVNTGITRVARDYYYDAKLALGKLKAGGFSRIGMVLDTSIHERTDRRYVAAFRQYGKMNGRDVHFIEMTKPEAQEQTRCKRWLKLSQPDVVLTDFAKAPEWIPSSMPQARLMVRPGEAGPGVQADFKRIGAEAMRILDGLLRESRLGLLAEPVTVLVPGVWVA